MSNHWTQHEIARLRALKDEGLSNKVIAHRLGRPVRGVVRKVDELNKSSRLAAGGVPGASIPARGVSSHNSAGARR